MKTRVAILLAISTLALADDARAQGRGRPKQPKPAATQQVTAPAAGSQESIAQPTLPPFRQFGTWLDDASVAAPGSGWTSIGVGYWRVTGGSQVDVPILNLAYGVANRVQLAATVPFYRVNYLGSTARGVDDMYFSAKVVAVDPTGDRRVGFAVTPLVEILSAGSTDRSRLQWALPVSAELRAGSVRLYGSTGYFSRGAVFTGGALEWTSRSSTMLTAAITQSLSTSDVSAAAAATSRNRVDMMAAVAHPLTTTVAGFASIGRTLTSIDEGGTSFALTGGISVAF